MQQMNVGQAVRLANRLPNDKGFLIGDTATVSAASNLGTKKRPNWQYQLDNGLWCDGWHVEAI